MYSDEFCQSLERLVELAPPISKVTETPLSNQTNASVNGLQNTTLFQSILVTHFHHYQLSSNNNSTEEEEEEEEENDHEGDNGDEEKESFDPPWPTEHEAFCALPTVQEHVLLEIAAGRNSKGETVSPMQVPKGQNMKVILPGSLRERGDYCLVDVAFTQGRSSKDYQWRVHQTQFFNLPE